jgi:uncharacterized Zn finger protein (UPF0148 family)
MSDFDREAEREKLREKYERDKEKRAASERMSELLLQGATMTNRHCPACRSPVFRYDGREFCPTCEKEVTEDGELLDGDDGQAASDAEASTAPADADGNVESKTEPRTDRETVETTAVEESDESSVETDDGSEPTAESAPTPARDTRPARVDPPARRDPDASGDEAGRSVETGMDGETLRTAERTLVNEIGSLTQRAAETRDVGRKRDLLAAAREAAETLESVRRL